ncbi:MAG: hypothetical protein HQ582_11615 [Planctomycetes bacterium]|nr:hypothetical protein [Planctomycetota bacterium]
MQLHKRTLVDLAEMICGAAGGAGFERLHFRYRSSTYLTEFFLNCDMEYTHDGSTRKAWVLDVLTELNAGPASNPQLPPDGIVRVIQELMDAGDFQTRNLDRDAALAELNTSLARNGIQAYLDGASRCHLRNDGTHVTSASFQVQRRAWTDAEIKKRKSLSDYLETASEDDFIENILQPLFQQLGFIRISVTGHKDRALEYGKDIWMKYQLPTTHYLYFGVQVKRTKIDASGRGKNENVAEILNQVTMMLGHPIWDPETNRQNLVDHVFIISAAEITKQAKNWLGQHLDQSTRRHIMFMDRDDLLNLAVSTNLRLPTDRQELQSTSDDDSVPF